jgi:hypothetical protein
LPEVQEQEEAALYKNEETKANPILYKSNKNFSQEPKVHLYLKWNT